MPEPERKEQARRTSTRRVSIKGASARDFYADCCREQPTIAAQNDAQATKPTKCKPNSVLLQMLSDKAFDLTVVDLSQNYVGPNGIRPILKVVQQSRHLEKLNLANNFLENDVILEVVKTALDHPTLNYLDVSGNPITDAAGMALLKLAMENPRIQFLEVSKTSVSENIVATIRKRLQYNQRLPKVEKPAETLSERLRAVKTVFQELAKAEKAADDRIRKKNILAGYKAYQRSLPPAARAKRPEDAFAFAQNLQARCGPDKVGKISWEAFLIVSMCPEVRFVEADLIRLKEAFNHWDKNRNGVIEMNELKEMMTHINGKQPTNDEVMEKLLKFGGGGDGNQVVNWDMFVLMLYEWLQGVPSVSGFTRAPGTAMMIPPKTPRKA